MEIAEFTDNRMFYKLLLKAIQENKRLEIKTAETDWFEIEPIALDVGDFRLSFFRYYPPQGNSAKVSSQNIQLTSITGYRNIGSQYSFTKLT